MNDATQESIIVCNSGPLIALVSIDCLYRGFVHVLRSNQPKGLCIPAVHRHRMFLCGFAEHTNRSLKCMHIHHIAKDRTRSQVARRHDHLHAGHQEVGSDPALLRKRVIQDQ